MSDIPGPESISFTAPAVATPEVAPVTPNHDFLPESYRDKEFLKPHLEKENPMEEILKHYEQLHSKPADSPLPGPGATDEEWENFFSKTRPEKPDAYELPDKLELGDERKYIADQLNDSRQEILPKVKEAMHKYGLTKKQAEGLTKAYDDIQVDYATKQTEKFKAQQKEMDQSFDKLLNTLGPDKNAAVQAGKEFMFDRIPKEILPAVKNLPNEAIVAMVATIHAVTKDKFKEDSFMGVRNSSPVAGDLESARKELTKIQSNPAYTQKFHPEYNDLQVKARKLASIVYPVK
jgi:hypothetical protein